MINRGIFAALSAIALMGSAASAQTLPMHRIPAALAFEAASETVAVCAKQGYHETAQVVDTEGMVIAERAKGEDSILPLAKLPHVMFFGGGVPIKLGDEILGAIGASGAPGGKLDDACARAGLDKIKDRLQ